MSAFAALKKKRSSGLNNLIEKLDSSDQGYANPDDGKYWQPTVDQSGNGFATIRFLDAPAGESNSYVKLYTHAFKGPTGKWYIENCLSTIGKDDPINEYNNKLWNSGNEEDKEIVRAQKRKLNYISNILVIDDPAAPENNGKVFLFKFGKRIFDKIKDAAKPEFADETPTNVFDLWEGANFRLKIRKVDGYRNYDKSDFDQTTTPIAGSDEEIEAIWNQCHSLAEVVSEDRFKPYEELVKRMNLVLELDGGSNNKVVDTAEDEINIGSMMTTAEPKQERTMESSSESTPTVDDSDDDIAFFESLTKG